MSDRRGLAFCVLGFSLLAVLTHAHIWLSGTWMLHVEESAGWLATRKALLPEAFRVAWDDGLLMGVRTLVPLDWAGLMLWLLPLRVVNQAGMVLNAVLGSVFLVAFLRERKLGWAPSVLGALAAFWLGRNGTAYLAGGLGMSSALLYFAVSLWMSPRLEQRRGWAWPVLFGACAGMMVMGGRGFGVILSLVASLFVLLKMGRRSVRLWPAVVCAALLLGLPAKEGSRGMLARTSSDGERIEIAGPDTAQRRSWPAREFVEWLAPGFMGWSSVDPSGRYWGSYGVATGEDSFRVERLDTPYLGLTVLLLAGWGLEVGWRRRAGRRFLWFWSFCFLFSVGLSCVPRWVGGLLDPYDGLRVAQWAMGLLASVGLQSVLQGGILHAEWRVRWEQMVRFVNRLAWLAGILALLTLATWPWQIAILNQSGWGPPPDGSELASPAVAIVRTRIGALAFAALTAAVLSWAWRALLESRPISMRFRRVFPWGMVAVSVVDVLMLSRHYVRGEQPWLSRSNVLVEALQHDGAASRLCLMGPGLTFAEHVSSLLPYHDIATIHPRGTFPFDASDAEFMAACAGDLERWWNLTGVSHVLLWPTSGFDAQQNARFLEDWEPLLRLEMLTDQTGDILIRSVAGDEGESLILFRRKVPTRFMLVDDEMKSSSDFEPGWVNLVHYDAQFMVLKTEAEWPTVLRVADRFDSDWRATVDGQPKAILPYDGLLRGLVLEAGSHTVAMVFTPSRFWFALQGVGYAWVALALLFVLPSKRKLE